MAMDRGRYRLHRSGWWRFVGATGLSMLWWLLAAMGVVGLAVGGVMLEPVPLLFGFLFVLPLAHDVLWCYAETNDDGIEWRTFLVRRKAPWSDIGELTVVPFSLETNLLHSECIVLKRPGRTRGQRVRPSAAASRPARAAFVRAADQRAQTYGLKPLTAPGPTPSTRALRTAVGAGVAVALARSRRVVGRR